MLSLPYVNLIDCCVQAYISKIHHADCSAFLCSWFIAQMPSLSYCHCMHAAMNPAFPSRFKLTGWLVACWSAALRSWARTHCLSSLACLTCSTRLRSYSLWRQSCSLAISIRVQNWSTVDWEIFVCRNFCLLNFRWVIFSSLSTQTKINLRDNRRYV